MIVSCEAKEESALTVSYDVSLASLRISGVIPEHSVRYLLHHQQV